MRLTYITPIKANDRSIETRIYVHIGLYASDMVNNVDCSATCKLSSIKYIIKK